MLYSYGSGAVVVETAFSLCSQYLFKGARKWQISQSASLFARKAPTESDAGTALQGGTIRQGPCISVIMQAHIREEHKGDREEQLGFASIVSVARQHSRIAERD
jgi:hypothetical protein